MQFFQITVRLFFTDVIVVSFGGYWSFWPSLLGCLFNKPVYIIVHGTDACNFPEIGYGNLRKKVLRIFTYLSFKWATRLLPVSESLMFTINDYYNPKVPKKLGVLAEFPNLNTPYTVVPNGLNTDFWLSVKSEVRTPNTFVTVASGKQLVRKGIDLMMAAATQLPEAKFFVIGCEAPKEWELPQNVVFTGRLPQSELLQYFQSSQFYIQLSVFEGFGLSLCEAMLCGCVPIGSKANFIPEIICDPDLILSAHELDGLLALIKKLSHTDPQVIEEKSEQAKQRIAELFPLSKRKKLFATILHGLN
jgi:glycosyltransferase involved in cell wall biosynthesis